MAWLGFMSRGASNQNGRPLTGVPKFKQIATMCRISFYLTHRFKVVELRRSQFFILNILLSLHLVVQRGRITRPPTTKFVALTKIQIHTQFEKKSNTVNVMSSFV